MITFQFLALRRPVDLFGVLSARILNLALSNSKYWERARSSSIFYIVARTSSIAFSVSERPALERISLTLTLNDEL